MLVMILELSADDDKEADSSMAVDYGYSCHCLGKWVPGTRLKTAYSAL